MSFDLSKFRNEFLQSDGWKVSDCYKPYEDKFLRKDVQDAYEGAKWGFEAGAVSRQTEINELKWMLKNANGQADDFCKKSIELQNLIDEALEKCHTGIRKQGGNYYLELIEVILKGESK